MGKKQTSERVQSMSALPPKADINHRERNVGFVPFCSVDNLARNTEGAHGRSSPKSLICRPAASDRLHKKYIFCTKSSPLMGLYVQSRTAPLGRARVQGWISGFGVPADPSPSLVEPRCATAATRRVLRCGATTTRSSSWIAAPARTD